MKIFILSCFAFILISCSTTQRVVNEKDINKLDFFKELVFGAKYGDQHKKIIKWYMNINIFVKGNPPDYLKSKLITTIGEINNLIGENKIKIVDSIDKSNYIFYFGDAKGYAKFEPNALAKRQHNTGLFWVYYNRTNAIYKATAYVNTTIKMSKKEQINSLILMLAGTLGIMNKSYKYPDSVFYGGYNEVTEYSDMDKFVISFLYSDEISSRTNKYLLENAFISLQNNKNIAH